MARRAVMKESSKWRSCRAFERVARTRPSARGGKMPQALAGNERIAAEDDGDVVMPAAKGAPLVVVEAELTLEVFVDALGAPAFLGDPHELLSTGLLAQPRERVVGGGLLTVRPLDQKPVVTCSGYFPPPPHDRSGFSSEQALMIAFGSARITRCFAFPRSFRQWSPASQPVR